jgi:hypothetical protein
VAGDTRGGGFDIGKGDAHWRLITEARCPRGKKCSKMLVSSDTGLSDMLSGHIFSAKFMGNFDII